jgi:hypothetical protein
LARPTIRRRKIIMGKSVIKEKRKLYKQWTEMKDIANSENMRFEKFRNLMEKEKEIYNKWKFLDNLTKAKEKIENEKKI